MITVSSFLEQLELKDTLINTLIGEIEQKVEEAKKERKEITEILRSRILSGEEVDDRIGAFLSLFPQKRGLVELIRGKLLGKAGQLVLLVTSGRERTLHGGPGSGLGLVNLNHLYVGELRDDEPILDFEKGTVHLFLFPPIICSADFSKKISVVYEIPDIELLVSPAGSLLTWREHESMILIAGDERVEDWFERQTYLPLYRTMVDALDIERQTAKQ